MLKTLQVWTGTFPTLDATGALATPSVGPVGTLYVAGDANAAVVTISGSNPYKFNVTLPALTAGQSVEMYVTATIAGIATSTVVDKDIADTAYGSEALRPTVAGRTLGVDASGAINSVISTISANLVQINGDADLPGNLAMTGADSDTLKSLSDQLDLIGGSLGLYTDTITVRVSGLPVDGALVQVATDSAFANIVRSGYTNSLGQVTFLYDAIGTYYGRADLAGYNIATFTITVSA